MRGELLASALLVVAAALVPAVAAGAAANATVDVDGGGLTVDGPSAVELPAVRLTGDAVTVEAPVGPFQIVNTRPAAPGWTLVATATRPRDPLGREMGAPLVMSPRAAPGGVGLLLGADGALDAPRAILSAPQGLGAGLVQVVPVLRLSVPADTPSAPYTATFVVTIS